jgi:hypothetical protein
MEVCIVIPVYKSIPNAYERISLLQCNKILHRYPIRLIGPQGFQFNEYFKLFDLCADIKTICFPKRYFLNPQTYNDLLKSQRYFKTFVDFDYILMHHTDSYVFKDELHFWCEKQYDYIGAPLYEYDGSIHPNKYIGIGNGGFSLHKVAPAIKVLHTFKLIYSYKELKSWWLKYNWKGRIVYLPYFLRMLMGFGRNSHSGLNNSKLNEDVFWGIQVPEKFSWYRVASFEDAFKFSMEYNCEELMRMNQNQLPFGCHQWYKNDFLSFWKKYIEID